MLTETSDYDKLYREFRWEVPARFNIAAACCDRHADGSGRLALIDVGEDGRTQRLSFDEMSALSCRFANVLEGDGLYLEMTEPLAPAVVRPVEDGDFLTVIMPMQLQ